MLVICLLIINNQYPYRALKKKKNQFTTTLKFMQRPF